MVSSKYNVLFKVMERSFVFNLASQALIEIDNDTEAFICDPTKTDILPDDDIYELEQNGIIAPSHEFETARLKTNVNQLRYAKDRIGLFISMTPQCNLNCTYCYQDTRKNKHEKKIMTEEKWSEIYSFLKARIERDGVKMMFVSLFGGEPMLDDGIAKKVVQDLKSLEKDGFFLRISMITNGTLFTEENVDYFMENMHNIQITLDGPKDINDKLRIAPDGTGSFDRIIDALRLIQRHTNEKTSCEITLRVNVTEETVGRAREFVDWLVDENLSSVCTALVFHEIFDTQGEISAEGGHCENTNVALAEKLIDLNFYVASKGIRTFKELGGPCLAKVISGFAIDEDLIMYTCPGTLYDHAHGQLKNGEIEVTDTGWYDCLLNDPKCIDACKYAPICYGGCNWAMDKQEKNCRRQLYDVTVIPRLQAYIMTTYAQSQISNKE